MQPLLKAVTLASFLVFATTPAFAHHNANAQYQTDKVLQMVGTLVSLRDIQPHARWVVETKNVQGIKETWDLEGAGKTRLRAAGIAVKTDLIPGQQYTFFYSPARGGARSGVITGIIINGKKYILSQL